MKTLTPARRFYREHKLVSAWLSDLERTIAKTDFTDNAEVSDIKKRLEDIFSLLKGHAEHEDKSIHQLLRDKGSTIQAEIESDHLDHASIFAHLENQLTTILDSKDINAQIDLGYQFYLDYRHFVGLNLIHLHHEETKIMPELQRLCTEEELREIEYKTYRIMTPEQIIDMIQVLFPYFNADDKGYFLEDIKNCVPEKFAIILPKIAKFI